MPDVLIKCDVCFEIICKADIDTLVQPITGSMFRSPDTLHGLPDPFDASLTWETMRCPYGPHRPFVVDHEVMTTYGVHKIPEAIVRSPQDAPGSTISEEEVQEPVFAVSPWEIAEANRKRRAEEVRKKGRK